MRSFSFGLIAATTVAFATLAVPDEASARPFVVLRDAGGTASSSSPNPISMRSRLLEGYAETGLPLPEIFTVWTTFPMNGSNYGTFIDPTANDVSGIGIPLKDPHNPPLRAVLWHSNFTALDQRAALHRAPVEGYGRYLFLLELSHVWGPTIQVPSPGANDLIGFPYHWSFFLDAGGGPAGGNVWTDNGDGTFTAVPGDPATVAYSPLDLYLLGLAEPEEVGPFGVLIPTAVPSTPTDPFWGGTYAAHSFPWFEQDAAPFTVTADRRELTIDDVIATNGPRDPVAGTKTSFTLGIVLMVPEDATDEDIAAASADFEPFAEQLAPAFADATGDRGSLEVVTNVDDEVGGGGGAGAGGGAAQGGSAPEGGAGQGGAPAQAQPEDDDGGCAVANAGFSATGPSAWLALTVAIGAALGRLRRRAQITPRS